MLCLCGSELRSKGWRIPYLRSEGTRISALSPLKKYRKESVGISDQFHMEVHRWCTGQKQPRVWELPGPDVSHWIWDQRHDREQHFWFLPGFTSVDREVRSTSYIPFMTNVTITISISQIFRSWEAVNQLCPPVASLSHSLYDMPGLAPCMKFLFGERHDFQNKLLEQVYVKERLQSSLKKFYGRYGDLIKQYEVPLSIKLNHIL